MVDAVGETGQLLGMASCVILIVSGQRGVAVRHDRLEA